MLLVRPQSSIFQQIILPYLSNATSAKGIIVSTRGGASTTGIKGPTLISVQQQRTFNTSNPVRTPPDAASASGELAYSGPTTIWEPYEAPASSASSSRTRRTREYLGLGDSGQDARSGSAGDVMNDPYMRTTSLALDRIIRSHQHVMTSRKGKERQVEDGVEAEAEAGKQGDPGRSVTSKPTFKPISHSEMDDRIPIPIPQGSGSDSATSTRPLTSETPNTDTTLERQQEHPFPPLIHQLLQARQFRLTTLHILNHPSLALDPSLVTRVAGYMDRHGGQAAARRLRKGKVPAPRPAPDAVAVAQLTHQQDHHENENHLSGSASYPFAPSDLDVRMPGITNNNRLSDRARLTAFYNTQLSHQLSSSHTSKGFRPPKSFPLPNTSLRQLRALLARIHHLESTHDFVPDRVTANLVLSCWMRSALAPPPDGVRIVQTRDKRWMTSPRHTGLNQDRFGTKEMRRLFNLVSRLFDRSASQIFVKGTTTVNVDVDVDVDTEEVEVGGDPDLSYLRHVKPFVKIFQHGFKQRQDRVGLEMLREWEERIRLALSRRPEAGR